jgi:hypothetical protein
VHQDVNLYEYAIARVANLGEIRVVRGNADKLGDIAVCMISAEQALSESGKTLQQYRDQAKKTLLEALPQFIEFCNSGQAQTLLIVCEYNSVSLEMCEYAQRLLLQKISVAYKHW